jgi:hypothetical protein
MAFVLDWRSIAILPTCSVRSRERIYDSNFTESSHRGRILVSPLKADRIIQISTLTSIYVACFAETCDCKSSV